MTTDDIRSRIGFGGRTVTGMLALGLLIVGFFPDVAWGQATTSASIVGSVTDNSGAAIPNAKVTATSPALQLPQITAVADEAGAYKLVNLPAPGVYRVSFEAPGFTTSVREGINLSVGFTATINAALPVGAVTQTVTVSTATPAVDVVGSTVNTTLDATALQTLPIGATVESSLPLSPGFSVSRTEKPDVGDSNLDSAISPLVYGALLYPTMDVDGINSSTDHFFETSSNYFSSHDYAEEQVRTTNLPPDISTGGLDVEAVVKSGGNQFHGDYQFNYEPSGFQASNLSSAYAALGLTNATLQHYYDVAGDIGGRIIRNKLWFYGGFSRESINKFVSGFVSAPNSSGQWIGPGTTPAPPTQTSLNQYNLKLSYQLNHATQIIGLWQHGLKFTSPSGSATTPLIAAEGDRNPENLFKGEIQIAPNAHWLVDAMYGGAGYVIHERCETGSDVAGDPSSEELSTRLLLGSCFHPYIKPNYKYQANGFFTYLPSGRFLGGTHQLKFGTGEYWETNDAQYAHQAHGDYELVFNDGVPDEIITDNAPVKPTNHEDMQSLYLSDLWAFKRVSLNLGVRWERHNAFFPTQSRLAGEFSTAVAVQGETVNVWNDVVPRIGAAWNVTGSGKTAIKGSFAMYGDTFGAGQAAIFNANAISLSTYKWTGPCVQTAFKNNSYNNSSCDADPATLASLKGNTNFISASGGINTVPNPNLKPDITYQYVASFEQQVAPNTSVSATYVQNRVYNLYYSNEPNVDTGVSADSYTSVMSINKKRPYSAWNQTTTKTDALTGAPVTIYYYLPAYAGAAFNQFEIVNAPSNRPDSYNTISLNLTKVNSKKFNGLIGYDLTKNHEWIQQVSLSPNDDRFPIDNTWSWAARAEGSYEFPLGIVVSAFFQSYSGAVGQRTESFSGIDQITSVTLRMGPMGQYRNPEISLLSSRIAKVFRLGGTRRLQATFEAFNITNSNAATSVSHLTGSTFGHVQSFIPPMVARFGLNFSF